MYQIQYLIYYVTILETICSKLISLRAPAADDVSMDFGLVRLDVIVPKFLITSIRYRWLALFAEELGPDFGELLVGRHVVNADLSILHEFAEDVEETQYHVFRAGT